MPPRAIVWGQIKHSFSMARKSTLPKLLLPLGYSNLTPARQKHIAEHYCSEHGGVLIFAPFWDGAKSALQRDWPADVASLAQSVAVKRHLLIAAALLADDESVMIPTDSIQGHFDAVFMLHYVYHVLSGEEHDVAFAHALEEVQAILLDANSLIATFPLGWDDIDAEEFLDLVKAYLTARRG